MTFHEIKSSGGWALAQKAYPMEIPGLNDKKWNKRKEYEIAIVKNVQFSPLKFNKMMKSMKCIDIK